MQFEELVDVWKNVREAVPRAALDLAEEHVLASCSDGNAVVSRSNDAIGHLDIGGVAEVHTVGVGAFVGGGDLQVRYLDVGAVDDLGVEAHGVHEV